MGIERTIKEGYSSHRSSRKLFTMSAATPAKKKAAKPKKPASHPKFSEMIKAAITNLKEKKGSSRQAIAKYILANYSVDGKVVTVFLGKNLKSGVTKGTLKQSKGTGASGSFKLADKAVKPKVKKAVKPKAKKPAAKKPKATKKPAGEKKAKKPKAKKPKSPKKAKSPKPKKAKTTPKKKPAAKPKAAKKVTKPKKAAAKK